MSDIKQIIEAGQAVLGIEFGSTRIKAVLIEPNTLKPIAQGAHEWENRLEDGFWTYHLDDIWGGLQDCYHELQKDVKSQYGCEIMKLASIGFSAMMHGYMAFDKDGNLYKRLVIILLTPTELLSPAPYITSYISQ